MTPEAAMRLALVQARRASGRSFPNPPVGAVVFRGDRVLGRGYTRPVGGDHAEVVAIRRAIARHGVRRVRGATLAVTLEPCCHEGRTGPCTERVIDAELRGVIVGHLDPHGRMGGGGVRRLRRAGVEARVGVLEAECREQHRGFISVCERKRPFVSLKLASSLDGRIATASGDSRWISGERSRAVVHRLRARTDGVVVGSGTALVDDPRLTARRGARVVHRPVRVLVDSGLRVSPRARLYRGDAQRTWVLCSSRATAARRRAVAATGAHLIELPAERGRVNLRKGLRELARAGLTELLVEGGGELAAALLRAGLVDEVHWFVAAKLLGGDGRSALGPLAPRSVAGALALENIRVRRLGEDVYLRGTLPGRGRR